MATIDLDQLIDHLARPQLGIVARSQLRQVGFDDTTIRRRVARARLLTVHPGVYRTPGTPPSYRRSLIAACLAAGGTAVASHRAALWLWRLVDEQQPVEITVARGQLPRMPRVVAHRPLTLPAPQLTTHRKVPVTNPLRSLVDAGAVLPRWRVGRCVEVALTRRLVTVAGLRSILVDCGGRGRAGAGVLRRYLDQRALGDRRPESALEPLMARLLQDHGSVAVVYQPSLVLDGMTVRPDFAVPDAKLVVEVDGLDTHGGRDALDRDLARQNLLARHGYLVLRYTVTHLRRPAQVAREIVGTARRRQSILGTKMAS